MTTPRSTKPEKGNKYYIRRATGGYSGCIEGKPKDKDTDVLANCVGFANGFLNELEGKGKEVVPLTCNAENFIERAIAYGWSVVKEPVLGGIMVWQKGVTLKGSDGAGHVAGVYEVVSPTQVKTAESGYNSKAFWTATRNKGNGNWGAGTGYTYRGCIKPRYWKPTPKPEPVILKYKVGDVVSFTGTLFGDSNGNKPGQDRKDLKSTIWLIKEGGTKPYNINNGLGWVAEADLKPYIAPKPEPKPTPTTKLKVGDKVKIIGSGNGSSHGNSGRALGIGWSRQILKVYEGRAFPYQVGNSKGTTGFYKEDALKKL